MASWLKRLRNLCRPSKPEPFRLPIPPHGIGGKVVEMPMAEGSIRVGGLPLTVGADVVTWFDSGMYFKGRAPRTDTHHIVLHWTGGEGKARQFYDTMRSRNLCVHFYVDHDGVIHQMMDADGIGAHAKSYNLRSVGIEVASKGIAPAHERFPRVRLPQKIHGKPHAVLGFYKAQTLAVAALCRTLCQYYQLPIDCPREDGNVHRGLVEQMNLRAFRGIIGHYHTTERKLDPGPLFMSEVVALANQKGMSSSPKSSRRPVS